MFKELTPEQLIQKLHDDLDTAVVDSYEDARTRSDKMSKFRSENEEILEKAEMLKSLGLVNTPTAKNVEDVEKLESQVKAEIELQEKYERLFPTYRFITREDMVKICKEHGLIIGGSTDYVKEIPMVNLEKIVNFQTWFNRSKIANLVTYDYSTGTRHSSDRRVVVETDKEAAIVDQIDKGWVGERYNISKSVSLNIAAPATHFDLRGKTISKDFQLGEMVTVNPDPIALHEVKGGYIIITAWDKEAEIPEIQNPLNN